MGLFFFLRIFLEGILKSYILLIQAIGIGIPHYKRYFINDNRKISISKEGLGDFFV